jgi:hypothetical protein
VGREQVVKRAKLDIAAPFAPKIRLSVGVTGHRRSNIAFAANRGAIEAILQEILGKIDPTNSDGFDKQHPIVTAKTRLHSLLVDGLDQIAAHQGLELGWDLVAPLPFGRALNTAINANPKDGAECRALLFKSGVCSDETRARADAIDALISKAQVFELAEQDDQIAKLYLDMMDAPEAVGKAQAFSFAASERVASAGQVMIEQSDFIIGMWDGASTSFTGGTGHTIKMALAMGTPVVWIDARAPQHWRVLHAPEALAGASSLTGIDPDRDADLARLVTRALQPTHGKTKHVGSSKLDGMNPLDAERWCARSSRFWHGYRRIEAIFGGQTNEERWRKLVQTYETPDAIATGSGKAMLDAAAALPGQQQSFVERLRTDVLGRFAWADGISARLSDAYRGGMILGFVFSAFAIVGGLAYLPVVSSQMKWAFALFELILLAAILTITAVGQKRRWHGRWFETRRVAEYLRHAPLLLCLGVARPPGRWPKGAHTSWPEWHALHALRDVGLPAIAITPPLLRQALGSLMLPHVTNQRDYHYGKAKRLAQTHHRLDKLSEILFTLAVISVSLYLGLKLGGVLHFWDKELAASLSKLFTFLGVLLPTFGGAIAGIRYFGDFERFSAISEVTAEKLDAVASRILLLLQAPNDTLTYAAVAELAHATDDIVIGEIESWQAVFAGKHITVPV